MFGDAWLTVRQAREALAAGRLDEADRLLTAARGHRKAAEQLPTLARAFAERGEQHLRRDNPEAAWTDLLKAESLAGADPVVDRLRTALARLSMAEVRALLEAGRPVHALELVARLRDRGVQPPDLRTLEEASRDWALAHELADRGEFALARQTADRVRLPAPVGGLERFRAELVDRQERFDRRLGELHDALDARRWREVIRAGDELLAAAPRCDEARQARSRAWSAVEPKTVTTIGEPAPTPPPSKPLERFLLWVDGVGGYLVIPTAEVTLGRSDRCDLPLVADVSRRHALLARDDEGWTLRRETGAVAINGQACERGLLRTGDRLTLGRGCDLAFAQPVAVSQSAVLTPTAGHRLGLGADAAILMGDTLLIGPGPQAHVIVPELPRPVILVRQPDGLAVRWPGAFAVDGQSRADRAVVPRTATMRGEGLSFALEPAPHRS